MMITKYKDLPKGLKEVVDNAMPSKGGRVTFQGLGIKKKRLPSGKVRSFMKNSIILANEDRIIDPKTGDTVDIAYVDKPHNTPVEPDKMKDNAWAKLKGKIQFSGGKALLRLSFDHAKASRNKELFMFLVLTNQNKSNQGKDHYAGGVTASFEMLDPKKTAKEQLEQEELVDQARAIVRDWDEKALHMFARLKRPAGVGQWSDSDEIKVAAMRIANKSPKDIVNFEKDYDNRFNVWIEKAIDAQLVEKGRMRWQNPLNKEEVYATYNKDIEPNDALKHYLLNEGIGLKERIEKSIGKL